MTGRHLDYCSPRNWRPNNDLHWANLLNRNEVRKDIIIIRELRSGQSTGDLDYWLQRLKYDWAQYRHFMGEQDFERRAWLDTQAALQMSKAIFEPMIRAAE